MTTVIFRLSSRVDTNNIFLAMKPNVLCSPLAVERINRTQSLERQIVPG